MKTYEAMFLVDTRHANRDWDRVVDQVKEMVTKHGGEIVRCEKWGERKLAYPIAGNKRGVYLLVYFQADGETPNEVYREVELSETFLRALILAVDKTPEEIAADGAEAETPGTPGEEKPAEAETTHETGEAEPEATPPSEPPAEAESA